MKYTLYILKNPEQKFYIGQTADLEKRLARHNSNRVTSTKNRGPWEIINTECFSSRGDAMIREKQLKKWRRELLMKLIHGS